MDPDQRAFVQRQWSKDEINVICATVTFGMGMFASLQLLFALINGMKSYLNLKLMFQGLTNLMSAL
jgi:fatty acid desaturase